MSKFSAADFMARVVAWPGPDGPGYVNAHWQFPTKDPKQKNAFRGRPFKTLDAFMAFAEDAAPKGGTFKELYYCMSTQRMAGRIIHGSPIAYRNKYNVQAIKSLYLDIDVGKPDAYKDIDEALPAIAQFCVDALLPRPSAIVFSGGGVHVYWINDKPLTEAEWRPYAEGLKAETQRLGLKCDTMVTADVARVLRIPGSWNRKLPTPRPVTLEYLGSDYDFAGDARFNRLATIVPVTTQVTAAVTGGPYDLSAFKGGMHPLLQGVLNPSEVLAADCKRPDLPLNPDEVVRGCLHFQDAASTKGAKHSEPLWNQTLLACTFFEDGRKWAHSFSKGHPGYGLGDTDQKFDQKLEQKARGNMGWPSCRAFQDAGANCKACPFFGKVNSPLALAARVAPPVPVSVVPMQPVDSNLPDGYAFGEHGWIGKIVKKKLSNGVEQDGLLPLFMCQLRDFQPVSGSERRFNFQTSLDGDTWGPASINEATDLVNEQTVVRALRQHGVKPFPDNQREIIQFMTSFMAKLDREKARQRAATFGWLYPLGVVGANTAMPTAFAYGGKVWHDDGRVTDAGFADPQLDAFFKPRGDEAPWWKLHKIVTDQNYPELEVIALSSFAAPLMAFAHQYNGVFNAYSWRSGAHKSTSIALGLSLWANPKMAKERPLSSAKGILRKLDFVRNLPVYMDEINKPEKMDEVVEMLGMFTEGGGASRLKSNRDFFKIEEWQTLMLVGSNTPVSAAIIKQTTTTDAGLQRIFEFEVHKRPDTVQFAEADTLVDSLNYNYGHMGLKYAELLGRNPAMCDDLVQQTIAAFTQAAGAVSEDRFRAVMASCAFAGAVLANKHLGTNFHLDEIWQFLIATFQKQKDMLKNSQVVTGTPLWTADLITQFMKSVPRNVLHVRALPSGPGKPVIVHMGGPSPMHPDAVHVRFAVDDCKMQISKTKLMEFLPKDVAYRGVMDSLKQHYNAWEEHRVSLNAGASVPGGRETVITVPVPKGSPWRGELYSRGGSDDWGPKEPDDDVTGPVTGQGPRTGNPTGLAAAAEQAKADLNKVQDAS